MDKFTAAAGHAMTVQLETEKTRLQADRDRATAEFDRELAVIDGKLARLQSIPDADDVCLECWVFRDVATTLAVIPGPDHEDHLRCPACGHVAIRPK